MLSIQLQELQFLPLQQHLWIKFPSQLSQGRLSVKLLLSGSPNPPTNAFCVTQCFSSEHKQHYFRMEKGISGKKAGTKKEKIDVKSRVCKLAVVICSQAVFPPVWSILWVVFINDFSTKVTEVLGVIGICTLNLFKEIMSCILLSDWTKS